MIYIYIWYIYMIICIHIYMILYIYILYCILSIIYFTFYIILYINYIIYYILYIIYYIWYIILYILYYILYILYISYHQFIIIHGEKPVDQTVPQALVRLFRLSEEQQLKVNEANIGTTGLGAARNGGCFCPRKLGISWRFIRVEWDFLEILNWGFLGIESIGISMGIFWMGFN